MNNFMNPYERNYQNYSPRVADNQGINWVIGQEGASAWLICPNQTALLMDSQSNRFYIKSADQTGMPTLRTFEYTEITPNIAQKSQAVKNGEEIPTREEINEIRADLADIKAKLEGMNKKKPTPKKEEVNADE